MQDERRGFRARVDTRIVECSPPRIIYRNRLAYALTSRWVSVVVASVALLLTLPVLALAAAAIRIEDGGPVLFTQKRVGRFGRLFTIYKLRTMALASCGDAPSPTGKTDSRVTRVGRFLRKTSIDELPQLINIIRGEMALVGPRPEMPFIVRRYEHWQHARHLVTPGITGLWQATCRSTIALHRPEATLLDLRYIASASHGADAKIVAQTVKSLVSTRGAY